MIEAFSFNREYDYVRLEGLQRVTGRSAHEWDLYILKELLDNALDADEVLWQRDPTQFPSLRILIEYISVPPPQCQQLIVRVANRALFPMEKIEAIFDTRRYTSEKAFVKGPTRGALGNALKTLLGIPYALHNRFADDWNPDLKPLSIRCNKIEYLPRYMVGSMGQTIPLTTELRKGKPVQGTLISVGVDYFVQEIPRTLEEIETFAQLYHLCNPHARFDWKVEIGNRIWTEVYSAQRNWVNKFRGVAPIQWYSLTAFKELLGALYRSHFGNEKGRKLPLKIVCQYFAGFNDKETKSSRILNETNDIVQVLWKNSITEEDISGPVATALYKYLSKHSPPFDTLQLGCIGEEHICTILAESFPIEGTIQYKAMAEEGRDSGVPFVIELAVARLQQGKRQIWTAINFSPTYSDPFLGQWLSAPAHPEEPVLGLRGLLDTYNINEDTPFILFLHLICPNIKHIEFSKAEIDHLPFEKIVGNALHELLAELRQANDREELRLKEAIIQVVKNFMMTLSENERFITDQLVEKVHMILSQNHVFNIWLGRPDAMSRLRMYIESLLNNQEVPIHHIARPIESILTVPSHPEHYFSVLTEHATRELLARHHVNKILYVQVRELEPVVIGNGWLCHMDMALLRNPPKLEGLEEALVECVSHSDLPVLILHNADEAGYALVEQMRIWLNKWQLESKRIVDLGLHKGTEPESTAQLTKLVEMMPNELATWLVERFGALGISVKSVPSDSHIRKDIRDRFDQLLRQFFLESLGQKFGTSSIMIDLDKQLSYTKLMINQALDRQIKDRLQRQAFAESYTTVLECIIEEFFEDFLDSKGREIRRLEQEWLTRKQSEL